MKTPLQILFSLAVLAAFVWGAVRILQRAGYPGWLAVLALIPFVNFLTFLWFAAVEWPVEVELRRLRAAAPTPGPSGAAPKEEQAWDIYHQAIGLEVAGQATEALAKFQQIIDTFPNTAVAQDAQKSIDALRGRLS